MEDILQQVSKDHRSIYFALQLKLMDTTQTIKLMAASFKENELKTVLADMVSHCYMLQGIFQEAKIPHIYQLVKSITINFNSVTALLLQNLEKAAQREASLLQTINARQNQNASTGKNEECVVGKGSLMKQIKKNRLGGIHLFNENYSRYLQDQKILEQIHTQKQKRLQRKRMDILSQSILQELSHQTDVEEFPANSDDIANYVMQTKDKNTMFNYVSYKPELQEILGFFQRSQQEANRFLMRKMRDIGEQEGQFSFADFQRDIHNRNGQMRRQVVEKMASFTDKYRVRQKEREDYIHQKEQAFKQAERKRMQRCDKQIETQLNFDQFLQVFDKQIKDLTDKCASMQSMGKQHFQNDDKQRQLKRQLIQKQGEINKLTKHIAEHQPAIESLKQLLKDERTRKIGSQKEIDYKSQRAIPQPAPFSEKERKIYVPPKQKSGQHNVLLQDKQGVQSNDSLMKYTANQNGNRQMSSSASFLSYQDVDRDRNGRQVLKSQKKITVRFQQKKRTTHFQPDAKLSEIEAKEALPMQRLEDKPTAKFQDGVVQMPTGTQKVSQKQQCNIRVQTFIQAIAKSTDSSNKQSSVSTPKQSSKAILQKTKKPFKRIAENENSQPKMTKATAPSLKKIKIEQRQSNPNSSSSVVIPMNYKKSQNPIKQVQYIQPFLISDDKVQPITVPQVQAQQSGTFQPSIRSDSKKVIGPYDMYQVTEEDEETAKPSAANSNQSSMKTFPNKQRQLLDKLNAQLKRITNQKDLTFNHLYSVTITPHKQLNTENRSIIRTQRQESQSVFHKDKAHRRVMKMFDNMLQNEGGLSQSKSQKLKRWKKVMMNHLKSQTISQDQAEHILSIIKGSSFNKNTSFYQNAISSIASVSHHIRNSLPQIQQITNLSSLPINSKIPVLKKVKPKHRLYQNQDRNIKQESRCILLTQLEQQMEDLITHQSLEQNFYQKFNHLHKHCGEGVLCTHVTKYFQSIMRHLQEAKKKERRSIALPVQHIGIKNKLEQDAIHRQSKPLQHNRSVRIEKPYDKGGVKRNYSLTKHQHSQQIILPSINENKFSKNGSISGLKHLF